MPSQDSPKDPHELKTTRISIYIPAIIHDRLRLLSQHSGMSISAYIATRLREALPSHWDSNDQPESRDY
jgi:hypothetical protein